MSPFRARAALGAAVALLGCASALPTAADAAVTSTVDGAGLHITSDDQSDAITLAKAGGVITINGTATTQPASINTAITVDAGGGNDVVDASALIATDYATLTVHGGNGNDTLTGGANGDALAGDAGDDRLVGFKNPATSPDVLEGGAGDDAIVWNNGDGTDIADGGGDFDFVEVNGSSGDDEFTIAPGATAGHVQFNRISLNGATAGNFGIDSTTIEQLTVNGLGGNDRVTGAAGLAALLPKGLALNGGDGNDVLTGGDTNDAIDGGSGNDLLTGFKGLDTIFGDDGNDTSVWNNGDGSDLFDGGDGIDEQIVNGSPTGDDEFTIAPGDIAGHVQFNRISLNGAPAGNFGIESTTIEQLTVNGLGGDDRATGAVGLAAVLPALALNGGDGNDVLTGGDGADAIDGGAGDDNLSGGAGNDTLTSGGGLDLLDGGAGDDMFNARDGDGDAVRGGAGTDSATTDATTIDAVAGVENLDATPIVAPVTPAPPAATVVPAAVNVEAAQVSGIAAPPADIRAHAPSLGAVTVTRHGSALTARLRVSCPAAEAGGCATTLTVATRHAVKLGDAKVVAVLGSAKVKLAGGHAATVSIRLASATARLATVGKLATTVSVVSRDAAGNVATASAARTLLLPKRR